jgi:parvulin-like peptidyl-prolyl isomerase
MNLYTLALTLALLQSQGIGDIPKQYLTASPPFDKVVARVNGKDIKASDVNDLLWQWRGSEATTDLISYVLIKTEAQKQQVDVSDKEVDEMLQKQIAQITPQIPQGRTVDDVLMDQGFPRSRLYLRIRTGMLADRLVLKGMDPAKFVKFSTIIVQPESAATTAISTAAKKADDLYARLKKGDDWDAVLNSATQNPNAIKSKGLVGWRELEALPEVTRTEMAGLKAGQFTKPVQTANGFQIFRIEIKGADAKGQDLEDLKNTYLQANRNAFLNKLRSEARIEKFLPGK